MAKKDIIKAIFILLSIIFILILFPVRVPVQTYEENSEAEKTIHVNEKNKLEQLIEVKDKMWLAGVILWTNKETGIPPQSPLHLEIISEETKQPIISKTYSFKSVYKGAQTRALKFNFLPHYIAKAGVYQVILSAPSLSSDRSLPIRRQFENGNAAYSVVAVKSVWKTATNFILSYKVDGEDFSYYWRRGASIDHGQNPYECVVDESCLNNKNPGHLPLFYYLSAQVQHMGLTDFNDFLNFWRPVFFVCYAAIGISIFFTIAARGYLSVAIFGLLFWLLNRWSFYVLRVVQIDFIALLPLLISIIIFAKHRRISYVLFGLSLAFKQMAIFLIPVYFLLAWSSTKKYKVKELAICLLLISIIPTVSSLSLFLNNPTAMIQGILFSATRTDEANLGAASFDSIVSLNGLVGTVPMFGLMMLVSWLVFKYKISFSLGAVIIFMIFLAFNTVLFNQYFIWVIPFLPLALLDQISVSTNRHT